MYIFSPNTLIKSSEINANFTELNTKSTKTVLLDVVETTDFANAVSCTQNTWVDIIANKTFTVNDSNSIIAISIITESQVGPNAGPYATRMVLDSAGTPINRGMGGANVNATSNYCNPFAGNTTHFITGLSAGSHTIKVQVYATTASALFYCRPATVAYEHYRTTILEIGK